MPDRWSLPQLLTCELTAALAPTKVAWWSAGTHTPLTKYGAVCVFWYLINNNNRRLVTLALWYIPELKCAMLII